MQCKMWIYIAHTIVCTSNALGTLLLHEQRCVQRLSKFCQNSLDLWARLKASSRRWVDPATENARRPSVLLRCYVVRPAGDAVPSVALTTDDVWHCDAAVCQEQCRFWNSLTSNYSHVLCAPIIVYFMCSKRTIHSYISLCDLEDILLIYADISITLPENLLFSEIYSYVSNKLTYYL